MSFQSLSCSVWFFVSLAFAGIAAGQTPSAEKAKEPIAIVAGQPIYDDDLASMVQAQLRQLRNQEYEAKSRALDGLVNQRLLDAEARKKGVATEKLLEQEVDAKIAEPTDGEVEAYYLAQKDRLGRPLEELRAQLRQSLKQARIQQARQEYLKRLREQAGVTILLRRPKVWVSYDPGRLRGNPNAPVMIVEFSDFQCPYCRRVQPTLKALLAKYGDQVSLAFRDFPLREIHPQAQSAAEAARCAGEQGKFWAYHDALFNASKLDQDSLTEQARTLGLDAKPFEACLASGKYKPQIELDFQDGTRAGVAGTPGFFINGIPLEGAQPQAIFEKAIDEELAIAKHKAAAR